MTVKTGSAWAGTFVTLDATGALATPSSGPAGVLYVDGTANAATVTITGSNPYKWAVTLPSLTAGQRVDMYITATIATIATAGIVASAQADTALLSEVKTDTAAILADTGTDGVKVASLATDSITADALKADAVTKIQSGLALEATLTAIKGAGWTDETLAKIVVDISNIAAGSGATAQEVWEYATRVLTAGTNIDLSALATASALTSVAGNVNTIDGNVETMLNDLNNGGRLDLLIDAIKAKTDNLPAAPANETTLTAMKGAGWSTETLKALMDYLVITNGNIVNADGKIDILDALIDDIKAETITHPTAAEVWSYGTRTLTTAVAGAVTPAEGDVLEITKDSTVIINLTGLGDISAYNDSTSGHEDKVWFTAKKSLDDTDASSIIQIFTLYPAGNTPPDTLTYINGVAATATEGTFQFTDLVAGNATITIKASAAANLPIYAVSPLYWDIKILDYSTGTVSVLASGEMYIYGTPTTSIA